MRCCGTDLQVIELSGGAEPLRMHRCTTCARRQWHAGTEAIEVDAAFALLAEGYRAIPRAARVARDRAATQAAARAAVRASREAERSQLTTLLEGWTVLGATG